MLIKLIPETDIEKAKHKEVEFSGVREFFLVGNRRDEDGYSIDFHEWEGGYRYLLSSLHWFYKLIDDERTAGAARAQGPRAQVAQKPSAATVINPMAKKGEVRKQNLQIISQPAAPLKFQATAIDVDGSPSNRGGDGFDDEVPEQEVAEEAFPDVAEEAPINKIFAKGKKPIHFMPNPNLTGAELDKIVKDANKKYAGNQPEE